MTTTQTLQQFLDNIKAGYSCSFDSAMQIIDEHYHFIPVEFTNGLGENRVVNNAGTNTGSCKIFAFARLHNLSELHTLELFGDYYREQVLKDPNGTSHANIRAFIKHGWGGVKMDDNPLQLRDG
ncbi:MAG: HopJ type III effector protein [Gammaproteobacteria bacterium]|nr:HopJ type III effector protein [Gammaproteobacteria bacterium]